MPESRTIHALGSSMGARLLSGERVLLSPARAAEIEVGDVVAFVDPSGHVVAHRVLKVEATPAGLHFTTRGDGAAEPDLAWLQDAMVGRISRDGALGRAIVRWPRLAVPLGAALRVRRACDLPSAVLAAALAVAIQLLRFSRRP